MTCIIILQNKANACSSSIHSLAAMLFQSSVEKGRCLLGKHGSCIQPPPKSSGNSVSFQYYPLIVDYGDTQTLEKFVVMMYNLSSTAEGIDDVRLDMFAHNQRSYEVIPLTMEALKQQMKHATSLVCTWSGSTVIQPESQTPSN